MSVLNTSEASCTSLDRLEEVIKSKFPMLEFKKQSHFFTFTSTAETLGGSVVAAITHAKGGYNIGVVQKKDGTYSLRLDHDNYYMVQDAGPKCVKIMNEYAKVELRHQAMLKGYSMEEESVDADGNIVMVANIYE